MHRAQSFVLAVHHVPYESVGRRWYAWLWSVPAAADDRTDAYVDTNAYADAGDRDEWFDAQCIVHCPAGSTATTSVDGACHDWSYAPDDDTGYRYAVYDGAAAYRYVSDDEPAHRLITDDGTTAYWYAVDDGAAHWYARHDEPTYWYAHGGPNDGCL